MREGGARRKEKPENVAYEKDFYRSDSRQEPHLYEKLFGKEFEGPAAHILRKVSTSAQFPPEADDHLILIKYIALIASRTPAVRRQLAEYHQHTIGFVPS
jgi:hypothetical protein